MTWSPTTTDFEMYFLSLAGVGVHVDAGSVHGHDQWRTLPADVLVPPWVLGKPVAFDTVTSSLNPSTFTEAGVYDNRISSLIAAEQ